MEKEYLLREKPLKALWLFALPMMVGNLFQQFYTMADSMIVGRFVGEDALAAIGASYALTNVFICIAIGGGVGAGVLTGRYFGAREYLRLRLCIRTALMTFLVLSLLLSAFGLLFCSAILRALHTPGNVLPMASAYLMIYFLGLPFLFLYNMLSAMFNALGRSRVPLYLLIFSSALNIGLDLCLVCGLELGIEGAAWATLAAQTVSAVLSFLLFRRTLNQCTAPEPLTDSCDKSIAESPLRQSPDSEIPVHPMSDGIEHHSALSITLFSLTELAAITRITLPSIFQQATVSIGAMLVQAVINPFGSQVLAGYAAASRLESFCIVPMSALGQAMSAYTSQNLGAAGKAIVSTEPLSQAHDTAQKNLSFPEADAETSLHYIKRVRQGYRAALALCRWLCRTPLYLSSVVRPSADRLISRPRRNKSRSGNRRTIPAFHQLLFRPHRSENVYRRSLTRSRRYGYVYTGKSGKPDLPGSIRCSPCPTLRRCLCLVRHSPGLALKQPYLRIRISLRALAASPF